MILGGIFASQYVHRLLIDLGTILRSMLEDFSILFDIFWHQKMILILNLVLDVSRDPTGGTRPYRP